MLDLSLPAPVLAPKLIGCELEANGVRGRIVETEAYQGEDDRACHASKGRTPRTDLLYRKPGTLYLYLVYGMHTLLNIVCDREGVPAAVLIRSLDIVAGEDLARRRRRHATCQNALLANGPGKVTQALALDRAQNGLTLGASRCPLRLYPATEKRRSLANGPRVGVDYAGPGWVDKPWRWWESGFPVVSSRSND